MKQLLFVRNILTLIVAILLLSSLSFAVYRRLNALAAGSPNPKLILWAWERPTDLRFIDPKNIGVAFLAKSIFLTGDQVRARPRLQPLELPPGTKVIAVTRIETDPQQQPALSSKQSGAVVAAILETALKANVSEIQIDFDATASERDFYRRLITDLRHALPPQVHFSITALASWCMNDNWISGLPIDEAVPMLFRMTNDGRQIITRLDAGDDFIAAPCRQSYGLSLDEKRPRLIAARRIFMFNPDAWVEESVRKIPESK